MRPYEEFTDIGNGHQIRLMYDDQTGEPFALEEWHQKKAKHNEVLVDDLLCGGTILVSKNKELALGYKDKDIWYIEFDKDNNLSLNPSFNCSHCAAHGWITKGRWGFHTPLPPIKKETNVSSFEQALNKIKNAFKSYFSNK